MTEQSLRIEKSLSPHTHETVQLKIPMITVVVSKAVPYLMALESGRAGYQAILMLKQVIDDQLLCAADPSFIKGAW